MRSFSHLVVVTALAAALSGCMPSTLDSGPPEPVNEVQVVLGDPGYNLNPYSPVLANRRVGHLIFSGLTTLGTDLEPEPELLSELPTDANGGISADGRRITYRLRDDVEWHDGEPVTARDVVFTLEQLRSGVLFDDSEVDYSNIESVAEEDGSTVTVALRRPDAPGVWRFAPFVLPAAAFESESDVYSSAFWLAPVGSGPYAFDGGVPGGEIRLEPRDGAGPDLRIAFGRSAEVQREAFDGSDAAVWVDGPASSAASEVAVETSSSVWQVWLFNAGKGHETSDPALRRVLSGLTPVDPGVEPATRDPWGTRLPERSVPTTVVAKTRLAEAGWRRSGDTRVKDGTSVDLRIASPTILVENEQFVTGYVAWLNGLDLKGATVVSSRVGQGGLFDLDRLALGDYDIARATIAVGAPYTIGWAFDSVDVPSLKRVYGSNVTRMRDSSLDERAAAVREARSPAEARQAMRALGERLLRTDTVLWDGQLTARLLVRGVEGVTGHPLPEYALASAPQWAVAAAPESR